MWYHKVLHSCIQFAKKKKKKNINLGDVCDIITFFIHAFSLPYFLEKVRGQTISLVEYQWSPWSKLFILSQGKTPTFDYYLLLCALTLWMEISCGRAKPYSKQINNNWSAWPPVKSTTGSYFSFVSTCLTFSFRLCIYKYIYIRIRVCMYVVWVGRCGK